MIEIYDRFGRVVAWKKEQNLFDLNGAPTARLVGPNLYTFRGVQLGRNQNGYILDLQGFPVGFMAEAKGGPILPMRRVSPPRPLTRIPPIPAIPQIPKIPAIMKWFWRDDWDRFIRGMPRY